MTNGETEIGHEAGPLSFLLSLMMTMTMTMMMLMMMIVVMLMLLMMMMTMPMMTTTTMMMMIKDQGRGLEERFSHKVKGDKCPGLIFVSLETLDD